MSTVLKDLTTLLDLERLDTHLFRGESRNLGGISVFGGQVIAQSLVAACRTAGEMLPHSLHAYFLRPGDMERPIIYEVESVRDGGSFATRRVQAIQNGRPILSLMASFHRDEAGFEHQDKMPDVPMPEALPTLEELYQGWLLGTAELSERLRVLPLHPLPFEVRPVQNDDLINPVALAPHRSYWFRALNSLADDPLLHRSIVAYASDFELLTTSLLPHATSLYKPDLFVASIDHALWFHRELRVDDWLLYVVDSPSAHHAMGFSRGSIFDRSGRLVASVAQEGLIRRRTR